MWLFSKSTITVCIVSMPLLASIKVCPVILDSHATFHLYFGLLLLLNCAVVEYNCIDFDIN